MRNGRTALSIMAECSAHNFGGQLCG